VDVDDLTADEVAGDAPVIGDEPEEDAPADEVVEDEPEPEAPAELAAALETIGANLDARQQVALAAEIDRRVALRVESDTRLATFSAKGVIPKGVRPQVEALLRHDDAAVRDGIAALLDVAQPPVKLRAPAGVAGNEPSNEDGTPTPAELKAMDFDQYTEAWAALTSEQRQTPEYRAAYREQ
jgi:hypothetical protein